MIAVSGPYRIHILFADDAPRLEAWEKPCRRLTWYLLVLCMDGVEEIEVEGKRYLIQEGESYLIPPGVLSSLSSRLGNRPNWIHFEVCWSERSGRHPDAISYAEDWEQRSSHSQPSPIDTWGVDLPVRIPRDLGHLFAETVPGIISHWKRGMPTDILRAEQDLAGLLLSLVEAAGSKSPANLRKTNAEDRFRHAERLARENLGSSFGVTEFAAAAGLSRSRFSVLYREKTGVSPGKFLRDLRLNRAETLLRDTDLPVVDIAALVGYTDPSVFGRVFRQARGISPAEWRKQKG